MGTYDLSKYRDINPDALTHFLLDQGWKEFDRKDGIVAIWGIEKEGEIRRILLPLNPGSPDYPNRILEAIKTVGFVEARKEADLLEVLLDHELERYLSAPLTEEERAIVHRVQQETVSNRRQYGI